jgi:glycosyltransferase involved in cell wall biosynthesis
MTKDGSTLRVLALMEATTVSGPAKNLIEFCRRARTLDPLPTGAPAFEISIATFHRGPAASESENGDGARRGAADRAPNQFVAAARGAGVSVDVIPERFRFDPRVVGELRSVVARRAPDIIQSHQIKSHFLVKLAGLWRERPWIAFHHGYTETDLKMQLYNRLNRWSLPAAHRVVTVCEAFAQQLTAREGVRPERISVRHNSIKAGGFACSAGGEAAALRERFGISEGERVVLAIGRLSREKGHADLVRALGRLRRARPDIDFKLLVVGEGPERARVERAAADEGIAGRVVFAGQVGDVRPYYAAADVLALPSHSEGSPNVLLETMAAGVPAVAAAVGGVPEIATHELTALLVAPRDPAAMAESLARLLTDARLAGELAANASALVAESYSPEAYARSLFGIYRGLMAGRKAAGLA